MYYRKALNEIIILQFVWTRVSGKIVQYYEGTYRVHFYFDNAMQIIFIIQSRVSDVSYNFISIRISYAVSVVDFLVVRGPENI